MQIDVSPVDRARIASRRVASRSSPPYALYLSFSFSAAMIRRKWNRWLIRRP